MAFVASGNVIPIRSGTAIFDVLTVFSDEYNTIVESLGSEVPGFGTWSSTSVVFESPDIEIFEFSPAIF